jgi:hypothetical protein
MRRILLIGLFAGGLAACGTGGNAASPTPSVRTTSPSPSPGPSPTPCLAPGVPEQITRISDDLTASAKALGTLDLDTAAAKTREAASAADQLVTMIVNDPTEQGLVRESAGLLRSAAEAIAAGDAQKATSDFNQATTIVGDLAQVTHTLHTCGE